MCIHELIVPKSPGGQYLANERTQHPSFELCRRASSGHHKVGCTSPVTIEHADQTSRLGDQTDIIVLYACAQAYPTNPLKYRSGSDRNEFQ